MIMIARISTADIMPTPTGGPLKNGSCRKHVGQRALHAPHGGHQHEDAPQPVDDRGNRRQQLGQEHERLAKPSAGTARTDRSRCPSEIGVASTSARIDE